MKAFREISIATVDGRFAIAYNGITIPIYSERSGARDLAQITQAIADTPDDHITLIIAPYAEALAGVFAAKKKFAFVAPVNFAAKPADDPRLIADDAALDEFINTIGANDKFSVYLIPQWREASDYVASAVRQLLERAAVRLKTIHHFEKLWRINFRVNAKAAVNYGDIAGLRRLKPEYLVMAGPSLDNGIAEIQKAGTLWCADTALPALVAAGVHPAVVFSVDAGFASREHFVGCADALRRAYLVCDILGFPAVQRLPFAARLTYASSHPLVQEFAAVRRSDLTPVENAAGDVGSLMRAVHAKFFPGSIVKIVGHDGKHARYVTHARGTAYFTRSCAAQNRLKNTETYMLKLSRRYA
jgi:hypothetical protein